MPIGKNSIKRVANNGYANLESSAPDMENSTVVASSAPELLAALTADAPFDSKKEKTPANAPQKTGAPKKAAGRPKRQSAKTAAAAPAKKVGRPKKQQETAPAETPKKKAGRPRKTSAAKSAAPTSGKKSFVQVHIGETLPTHLL